MGELEFDANGDIKAAPYVLWTVKGGEFGPVKLEYRHNNRKQPPSHQDTPKGK